MKLAELDGDDWIDDDDPLTADEKALLDRRLAAYEKDPDAGSSWEKLKAESALVSLANRAHDPALDCQARGGI